MFIRAALGATFTSATRQMTFQHEIAMNRSLEVSDLSRVV